MEKKTQSDTDFYVREGGKKIKLSFDVNSFATDQLFEVPAGLFKIYNPNSDMAQIAKQLEAH